MTLKFWSIGMTWLVPIFQSSIVFCLLVNDCTLKSGKLHTDLDSLPPEQTCGWTVNLVEYESRIHILARKWQHQIKITVFVKISWSISYSSRNGHRDIVFQLGTPGSRVESHWSSPSVTEIALMGLVRHISPALLVFNLSTKSLMVPFGPNNLFSVIRLMASLANCNENIPRCRALSFRFLLCVLYSPTFPADPSFTDPVSSLSSRSGS